MSKIKTAFFCRNCGAQSPKWIGKCPSCNEWNTYVEEIIQREESAIQKSASGRAGKKSSPVLLADITSGEEQRINIPDLEMNRVLGGGLVHGSLILLGGEPGIGKSTLLLQMALKMSGTKILYVTGEESERQIRMRAERLEGKNEQLFILTETSLENIFSAIAQTEPELVIVDSVQTIHTGDLDSTAGSIPQIKECAAELQRYSKQNNVPVFLIGHITKDGMIAGPKVLEHMVDTVLQFEGDRHHVYRIIRPLKNRFGSTNELGIYEMTGAGLREVNNPSEVLVTHHDEPLNGIAIAATLEGIRPLMIETQALVSSAVYGTPQRSCTGFDLRRLNMLLAVLEKRCGFRLGTKDVFLNLAGGIRIEDPALDLAVACAIRSSADDIAIPVRTCFSGEVGLSGEIRPVQRIEQRIAEAEKLGYTQMFISKNNLKGLGRNRNWKIEITPVAMLEEVFNVLPVVTDGA
jgi:DNA repair protein RadA/Sms